MREQSLTLRTSTAWRLAIWFIVLGLAVAMLQAVTSLTPLAPKAKAATTCPSGGCAVTVRARDYASQANLASYNFIVNVDNSRYISPATATRAATPVDPFPKYVTTESHSPIVAEGGNAHPTVHLSAGRYLISVRSLDHKMWGDYITLPGDAAADGTLSVTVDLTEQSEAHPLPLGKIRVFVFNDNAWTNGAPDTEEAGLAGFKVGLEEQTANAVTVDYNNKPLCQVGNTGAQQGCLTAADGFLQINDMGPATYFIDVHPPDRPCNSNPNSRWYQTTTIDGGLQLQAGVEEGSDGTGAPGEQLWEPPNNRTAYWFGFVCSPTPFATNGTGEVTGTARNWQGWPPFDVLTMGDPVADPFLALSSSTTDRTVWVGQGDGDGNFDIQNVPAGDYNLAVWDEQLSYIIRIKNVTVTPGATVDVNDTDENGEVGLGVSRWFGWLDGTVYKDLNNNGKYDAGTDSVIPNTDMDQRWRDGSVKEATVTDAQGHYEYPTAEGGALGKWIVNEQGFARFSAEPGPSAHDEHTDAVTPSCAVAPPTVPANPCVPTSQGGALLGNQLLTEGHRATVDWGKRDYSGSEPGQIVGITYFATTRNEFDARKQAHEDYEPAIPDVDVYLEGPGPDNLPNTADDVVLNKYVTDHWQQPNKSQDPQADGNSFTQSCYPIKDNHGLNIDAQLNPQASPACLETPINGEQTKDGAFDGGYAFADYCPGGYDLAADDGSCVGGSDPVPLVSGTYITHSVMPKDGDDTRACNTDPANPNVSTAKGTVPGDGAGCLYRAVKEEDVNVDLGNHYTTQLPEPPCTGDDHLIDQSTLVTRSNYFGVAGAHAPLCDKRLIVLTNGQNANADFMLMTNFRTDPNGEDSTDTRTGDVAAPGRIIGLVSNDIYFERDPKSMWYGEPRPIGGIPVGIYQRVDTVPNVNGPYDANNWRLFTTVWTSPEGTYEAMLPSTETLNCPIPQGPCPGMYLVKVDDPGTKANPNRGYDPNLLTATSAWDVWPGLTDQLDTPLDPISGTGCEDPAVLARPELLQVSTPYISAGATGTARRITVDADFIGTAGPTGATGGRVVLTDPATGVVTTLTRANGGVVSWTQGTSGPSGVPDRIVISVPAVSSGFTPGPKQLTITTSNANGGVSSVNGITVHVMGTSGATTYNPPVVTVAAPTPTSNNLIQTAINGAAAGSLIVLGAGTYNENVLIWKPVKIQGRGPGGIVGAHELQARDAEDPRFHVLGSVIDGRYFTENAAGFDATVAAHGGYAGVNAAHPVLRGADLTLVAQSTTAYDLTTSATSTVPSFSAARVDGLALMTGSGEGAGGIQLQAYANNTQLSNNVLENNSGIFAGGIGLGEPYSDITTPPNGPSNHVGAHNYNVSINHDRLIGNGGLTRSGGLGIFYGSNGYDVGTSMICANFGVEYGGGVSHWGFSPGGKIHDNQIYYNDAVDAGAGISIQTQGPAGGGLGDGSGSVDVDRNVIQANYTGDDGGGIFVLDALDQQVNIRNNMINENGSADLGGAIMIDDSSKVTIVNNTVANNVSTASSESSDGLRHGAGLSAEANDTLWQNDSRYVAQYPNATTRPDFANPIALFNNVFWNNSAYTLSSTGPGATLVNQGFLDFEIHGTNRNTDRFTPRFSDLTNGQILVNGNQFTVPANQGNMSANPGFTGALPITAELTVSGSRLDPQVAAVTITGGDPPVGLTSDYHLLTTSTVIDRGVRCALTPFPVPTNALSNCATTPPAGGRGIQAPSGVPADIDGQYRPQRRVAATSPRARTPWDLGADEVPGTVITLSAAAVAQKLAQR